MYRVIKRSTYILCGAVVVPKINDIIETPASPADSGWQRVKNIFVPDEFGQATPQFIAICQTTFLTSFFGAFYGGMISSREAYLSFIENNQATRFLDHLDAKKRLHDHVTVHFAKGALKWGWRLALFGFCYVSALTISTTYRNDTGILDFIGAGWFAGAVYRIHMGLRAVIVSSTLGSMVGAIAGLITVTVLRFTGYSLYEIFNFQFEAQYDRASQWTQVTERARTEYAGVPIELATLHDKKLNESKQVK